MYPEWTADTLELAAVSDGSDSESALNNGPITTKDEPSDTPMKEEGEDEEDEEEEEEDL